jgi:hypothetical protein
LKQRQYQFRRNTCIVLIFLMLVVPALFGSPQAPGQSKMAGGEVSDIPSTDVGVILALAPAAMPVQIHRMLLPGDDPALTLDIVSNRPLVVPAETRLPRSTPEGNVNEVTYRWDSSLWGRLDCLRQQRIRQRLFGTRAQRCSLG